MCINENELLFNKQYYDILLNSAKRDPLKVQG